MMTIYYIYDCIPHHRQRLSILLLVHITRFYRTQVSLGSGLWVPVSVCTYVRQFCETLLM